MKKIFLLIAIISFCSISMAQQINSSESDTTDFECSHSSLDIGGNNGGISFGNSQNWNGIRFNFSDCGIEKINGINITFWKPEPSPHSIVNGISLGLVPGAARLRGISIGLAAVVAETEVSGLNIGGLAVVSNGIARGINIGGLAVVSNEDLKGFNFGGLAVVANKDILGLNLSVLAVVANGNISGLNFGGLAAVANKNLTGINFGGLAVVANGELKGINCGGIAVVSNKNMRGINIGGLAVVSTGDLLGLTTSIGAIVSRGSIKGISVAGYKTDCDEFKGMNIALGWSEINNFTGFSVSGYNRILGAQTGIVIGLFNSADELHGVQIGIINIAKNNSGIAKILPFFNFHFD